MKAKINGIEVEGTVEEIQEIIGLRQVVSETVQAVTKETVPYKKRKYTKRAVEKLNLKDSRYKQLPKKYLREAVKLGIAKGIGPVAAYKEVLKLHGYKPRPPSYYQIKKMMKKMGTNKKKEEPHQRKGWSNLSARMKFMNNRFKSLMAADPRMSIEMARARASQEWQANKGKGSKPAAPTLSLQFLDDKDNNRILLNMIEAMIQARPNGKLTYPMDGEMLGIKTEGSWDNLLSNIMEQSIEVCRQLKCTDNFHIYKDGRANTLIYR